MKQNLNDTLMVLRQTLAFDYRIIALEMPTSPVFMAVALPLAPEVTGLKPRLPSGRGLSLPQAMVSAGAEAVELRASLGWTNSARIAALPQKDGRRMIEAQNLHNGETVLVPAQTVFLDHAAATGEPLQTDARSTGCATAVNRQIAIDMALLECIERDAIAFWWHGNVPAFRLPLERIDPLSPRLLWWLQTRVRQTRLLGLASQTGVPVVVAVSCGADGHTVAYGAAARFDTDDACLAAITEMVQTETAFFAALAAAPDNGAAQAARDWQTYACMQVQPQFNPASEGPPPSWTQHDRASLLARCAALDLQVLAVDLTLPDDPLATIRVLVPGLCDMDGRIDTLRFRHHTGINDPNQSLPRHEPEPF